MTTERITHNFAKHAARQAASAEWMSMRQAALADVLDYISQQETLDSAPPPTGDEVELAAMAIARVQKPGRAFADLHPNEREYARELALAALSRKP